MRIIRVTVDANETGIECDLTFFARTAPCEEPKNAMHDELKIAGESWRLSAVEPLDYKNIHIHQLVKAKMGDREGVGTLETICFGRHPSGFKDLLDGAS